MDTTGEMRIPASRDKVWAALNNPGMLRRCIPGCQSLDKAGPNEMDATVKVKVAFISTTFRGKVRLSNLNPHESLTITGEGSGGFAGTARGIADISLREDGDETIATYTLRAETSGKLALLGSRMIQSSLNKLAVQFFEKLAKKLSRRAEATET